MDSPKPKRKYNTHRAQSKRIMISLSQGLLDMADKAAEEDFTTRSEIIRQALLWYLRPTGRDFAQVDPDEIYEVFKRRKALARMRQLMKEFQA